MTAAEARDSLRAQLSEIGQTITVRRYAGIGDARAPISPEATTLARPMGYQPKDLVGSITQGDRRVTVLVETNSLLAAMLPLSDDDKLVIRGVEVAIKSVDHDTRSIKGEIFGLDIQAAG